MILVYELVDKPFAVIFRHAIPVQTPLGGNPTKLLLSIGHTIVTLFLGTICQHTQHVETSSRRELLHEIRNLLIGQSNRGHFNTPWLASHGTR
jgi:hypothetical protein